MGLKNGGFRTAVCSRMERGDALLGQGLQLPPQVAQLLHWLPPPFVQLGVVLTLHIKLTDPVHTHTHTNESTHTHV